MSRTVVDWAISLAAVVAGVEPGQQRTG